MPRGDSPLRRFPHVELGVGMNTTAAVLQQQYHSRNCTYSTRSTDPPTHLPKGPTCTAAQGRTATVREFVHADVVSIIMLHRIGISMFFRFFHVFTIPRHIGDRGRILSTLPAPRSPSLALVPVLSPATPRSAVWGGRGAEAWLRAVAWSSGEPFQNGAH